MSKHFEKADGLCEDTITETKEFVFNQTMLRIKDPKISLDFYTRIMGMTLYRKLDFPEMSFTLYFLGMEGDVESSSAPGEDDNARTTWTFSQRAMLELTHNWDGDDLGNGSRNFGHLAYEVENIYEVCKKLQDKGITINRPPRDGRMAFVKSPDNISIEILQKGEALEPTEPWLSMENNGSW